MKERILAYKTPKQLTEEDLSKISGSGTSHHGTDNITHGPQTPHNDGGSIDFDHDW